MAPAVGAFAPTEAVAGRGEGIGARSSELKTNPSLDLRSKYVQPAIVNRIFEPRMAAVAAVAPVPLDGNDRLGDRHGIFGVAEADHVAEARIGPDIAMRHAHTAADRDVPAGDLACLVGDRYEAEIVRQNVDV